MINPTLAGFFRKEMLQTLRDPRMRILIFIAPVIQLLLFGYAISTEVRNIKLAVRYAPGDTLARRFEERALHSGWFLPARTTGSDPAAWVQSGQADAVLVAPPEGLTRGVRRGGARVQLLVDATQVIRARAMERYVQSVLNEVLKDEAPGTPAAALSFHIRMLYNPAMQTAYFLVPGVMMMLLCLITVLLTAMALVREKELGTFEALVSAPLRNWEVLVGKTLPYMLLGLVLMHLILVAGILLFDLPFRGSYWRFLLAGFIFVCSTLSIGTLISTVARRQQQAMMATFLFLFPAIMLSGMMFPLENMPEALRVVAYLNPLKYMLTLLRNILLKGGDEWVFWTNLAALTAIGAVGVGVSFNRFRQSLF